MPSLAPVARARALSDEDLADQLAEHPRQTLLGDRQDLEQLAHRDPGVAADEVDDPVMGPAEAVLGQDLVRLGGEVPVGEEQHLDHLPELRLAQEQRVRP